MSDKKPQKKRPGLDFIPSEKEDPFIKKDQEQLRKLIDQKLKDKKGGK